MTQNGPTSTFMSIVRKALAEDMSEVARDVLAYDDLCRQAEEVDESGKLTKDAHRARSRLRHPFRLEESPEKTRKKVAEQERKRKRKVMDLLSETCRELAIWHEKRSELEEIDRHEATLTPVGKSREDHDPESVFALGSPLLQRLGKAGVAPSSFTRMPDSMITCIADLFKAHTKDPHLKDPDNPWRLMVNAGILEAPPRDLDEDQQRVVLHAYALRSEQQKEFAAKARRDLALPEGFSEHFLLGASRISDLARELSQGEYEAYYRCVGLRRDRDIELLGQVLGLDSEEDQIRLSVIVDLLSKASMSMMEDTSWTVALVSIKGFIDRIQPHKRYQKDWVNELIEGLPALADELSEAAGSIEVFDRFLMHGLGLSEAKRGFDERKEKRKQAKREADFWADITNACEHNWTFKIEDSAVIYEGVEWYSDLDAEEWTGARWIEVHGLPPELEKYYSSLNSDKENGYSGQPESVLQAPSVAADTEPVSDDSADADCEYHDAEFEVCEGYDEFEGDTAWFGEDEIDLAAALIEDDDDQPHDGPVLDPVVTGAGSPQNSLIQSLTHRETVAPTESPDDEGEPPSEPDSDHKFEPQPESRSPKGMGENPSDPARQPFLPNFDDKDMM